MANKTKKSYTKRIKMTKNGDMQVRPNNRCHYNSKERNPSRMKKKGLIDLSLPKKILGQMLPHGK